MAYDFWGYGMGINDRIFSVKGPYVGGDLTVWGKIVVGIGFTSNLPLFY